MTKTLGVVIGRFQISDLHRGHHRVIGRALRDTNELLILIGCRIGQPTDRDPLDYQTRRLMICTVYPQATVLPVWDMPSDELWSQQVDTIIETYFSGYRPVLFGSRDSFIPHYGGLFPTQQVGVVDADSATEHRRMSQILDTPHFRSGVIYAQMQQRYPTSYQVIDAAIVHPENKEVLLGKKKGESRWRFVGGFVDPSDVSLEHTVAREVSEEVGGIEIGNITYVGSYRIDDRRYRDTTDGVMSSFFIATYIFGAPRASDDLDDVRWFPFDAVKGNLIDAHICLGKAFVTYVAKNM